MQLVAYGAQDIYLTGNPQITFFKVVYRRHTNFSMESIQQTWNGDDVGSNARCTAVISRNGDLLYRMYLDFTGSKQITDARLNSDNIGAQIIKQVELEIGGQRIDRQSSNWMEVYSELTQENPSGFTGEMGGKEVGGAAADILLQEKGRGTLFQSSTGMGGHIFGGSIGTQPNIYLRIPLQFWFCRNPGLALPLIALQYHEVKVILTHDLATVMSELSPPPTSQLWCDYIYLDTDERRRFAQVSHEYLIEQVQEQSWEQNNQDLNFNHPVKELIWVDHKPGEALGGGINATAAATKDHKDTQWTINLNGHERFTPRFSKYFTCVNVSDYHTGPGGLDTTSTNSFGYGRFNESIYVYSFALKPEEHQPSGTCNFSRIDNAKLVNVPPATLGAAGNYLQDVSVFAVNYNVLRIMSGMGGLAYSN